jgi:hypothetical protein
MKPADIQIGQKYGRLSIVGFAGKDAKYNRLFFVKCECNPRREPHVAYGSGLLAGRISSCGCLQIASVKRTFTTHGMTNSPEYKSWEGMIQRCTNPKATKYENYGGRGIAVCKHWEKFENFYADMGPRPAGHSLDRYPDNDGNYEPSNCRWASREQQEQNKRPYVRSNPKKRPDIATK